MKTAITLMSDQIYNADETTALPNAIQYQTGTKIKLGKTKSLVCCVHIHMNK